MKMVGHGTHWSKYIQHGGWSNGEYDCQARKSLLMTMLMNKLG